MSRLAIFNAAFGFLWIALAAMGGSFIAIDITEGFINDPSALSSWQLTLMRSAHGHSNLFGMLHIAFATTLAWSRLSLPIKKAQTVGLVLGSLCMGPLMVLRSYLPVPMGVDLMGILVGVLLTAALLAVASHSYALFARLSRTAP